MEDRLPSATLDDLDFRILAQLQDDGRKSFTEIAAELQVSVGTVRNRMAALIQSRTLTVIGRVDPEKVGFHAYAHIFVKVRPASQIMTVARKIARLPEVSFLAMLSGEYDLEVNVMCRNNDHLIRLMNEKIHGISGVHETNTNMYLRVLKIAQPDLSLVRPNLLLSSSKNQRA
ncbi:MAG: Lrp/AsnC family transcriptional regulator [Chitinophagales bacterium]|nr:Lrp/AsnC family transcriptional regulator [Chitinophagales bacterium]MDW8394219.1 Lrp/AsnC family transcriptional regulator [Chitinophagales bacterium]